MTDLDKAFLECSGVWAITADANGFTLQVYDDTIQTKFFNKFGKRLDNPYEI